MDVGKNPAQIPGSDEWSIKIRRRARQLSAALDTGYMELAEILWKVWNTPKDNDPNNPAVFRYWGYENFAEYAEKELGLAKRRAERLRQIYHHVEVRLGDRLERQLKRRLLSLGWSKVREIAPIITPENALKWIEIAEKSNYVELTAETRNMRRKVEELRRRKEEEEEGAPAALASTPEQDEETEASPEDAAIQDDPAYKEAEQILNATQYDPEELRVKTKVFPLYPDMVPPVEQALARAAELSHSDSVSHNLTLICTNFLATNDFRKKGDEGNLIRMLAQVEKNLGVKLIAYDPKKKQFLYGSETIEALAEGR